MDRTDTKTMKRQCARIVAHQSMLFIVKTPSVRASFFGAKIRKTVGNNLN